MKIIINNKHRHPLAFLLSIKSLQDHRDCHVVFRGSFYSVPHAYVGQTVDLRADGAMVQLYAFWQPQPLRGPQRIRGSRVSRAFITPHGISF